MYVLHYAPDNASLIVRLVLEELAQPYRTALVDRSRREQDGEAYRRLHPSGLIPALDTPDGPAFETAAILLYLSERHGVLAPAPGDAERARFLSWLFFVSNTLHADIRLNFYRDRHAGKDADIPAFGAVTKSRITRHLRALDDLAGTSPIWFSAEAPSVLTLYVSCLIRWLALYPRDDCNWFPLADHPALHAIAAATEARPAAQRAALAEGLGVTIFTRPTLACPPEGSAT